MVIRILGVEISLLYFVEIMLVDRFVFSLVLEFKVEK